MIVVHIKSVLINILLIIWMVIAILGLIRSVLRFEAYHSKIEGGYILIFLILITLWAAVILTLGGVTFVW